MLTHVVQHRLLFDHSDEEITIGDDRDGLGLVEICLKQYGKVTQSIILRPTEVETFCTVLMLATSEIMKRNS